MIVYCGICSKGCPMDVEVEQGKVVSVKPLKGGLCAKGAASRQYLYNKERILYPMKRIGEKGSGQFEQISWKEAYEIIAGQLLKIKEMYGARSTVFYAGYPKWYRPALLRLANAYGSPNFCTESSTCFQASAMAWKSIYGNRICGPDLKNTKTLLVWSSNLYHSNTPMGETYQNLKKKGVNIIVVDPRNTVTSKDATLHLKLFPGTDGALALGMANVMIKEKLYDASFVEQYCTGFEEYAEYVRTFTPEKVEEITGVPKEQIIEAARMYASQGPSGIQFSACAVVHHVNGFQNYRAVFSLIALTGNYDVPGGNLVMHGPASPSNEFGKVKRTCTEEAIGEREFPLWSEFTPGEVQCTKLADAILEEEPYPIKAVFAMGLNHHMWPQPEHLQTALSKLDFFVNVDLFFSESCKMADLVLPACTPFEREEVKVLPGGKFGLNQQAVPPLGEAKNDIQILIELMREMGLEDEVLSKGYESYMEYILEPSGLTLEELRSHPEGMPGKVFREPQSGTYRTQKFQTPSGKIEFVSQVIRRYEKFDPLPAYKDFREETEVNREEYPFILSTGARKPQFFHARMYRLPWLADLEKHTLVELHRQDAEKLGIADGERVKVLSPAGTMTGIAAYSNAYMPGVVSIYHGNPKADANELIHKDYCDPYSGFPGYKSYFCRVEKAMPYHLTFDREKCVGCLACHVACIDAHAEVTQTDVKGRRGMVPCIDQRTQTEYTVCPGCTQCGECERVCPRHAITKNPETGFFAADPERCIGCGKCVETCRQKSIYLDQNRKAHLCDGCEERVRKGKNPACVDTCFLHAIGWEKHEAES